MDNIKRFETINDYNVFNNTETLHPLVSVIDMSKAKPRQASNMYFGFYTVFLKEVKCGDLRYPSPNKSAEPKVSFMSPGSAQSALFITVNQILKELLLVHFVRQILLLIFS